MDANKPFKDVMNYLRRFARCVKPIAQFVSACASPWLILTSPQIQSHARAARGTDMGVIRKAMAVAIAEMEPLELPTTSINPLAHDKFYHNIRNIVGTGSLCCSRLLVGIHQHDEFDADPVQCDSTPTH